MVESANLVGRSDRSLAEQALSKSAKCLRNRSRMADHASSGIGPFGTSVEMLVPITDREDESPAPVESYRARIARSDLVIQPITAPAPRIEAFAQRPMKAVIRSAELGMALERVRHVCERLVRTGSCGWHEGGKVVDQRVHEIATAPTGRPIDARHVNSPTVPASDPPRNPSATTTTRSDACNACGASHSPSRATRTSSRGAHRVGDRPTLRVLAWEGAPCPAPRS